MLGGERCSHFSEGETEIRKRPLDFLRSRSGARGGLCLLLTSSQIPAWAGLHQRDIRAGRVWGVVCGGKGSQGTRDPMALSAQISSGVAVLLHLSNGGTIQTCFVSARGDESETVVKYTHAPPCSCSLQMLLFCASLAVTDCQSSAWHAVG